MLIFSIPRDIFTKEIDNNCLKMRDSVHQFRDPVHGFIEVSEDELLIINSHPFQRLRNVRQLATTYLVYHGAEHTRFGHSLGVMHLVTRAFESVVQKSPKLFCDDIKENEIRVRWYKQILRLVGLTHDLGHAPFSHASEHLMESGVDHEEYTRRIIFETEIADHINLIGRKFQEEYGEQYEISPEVVWMVYQGGKTSDPKFIIPDFLFLRSFMDGELDCDKMDYLLRDSLYCGVTYGKYDLNRFISTLTVYKKSDENILQLAISSGGIQAFEEFVLARYFMFIQVYFHKTRRYFDYLLLQSLKEILPGGKYPTDVDDYLKWDDVTVLSKMRESGGTYSKLYLDRRQMTCIRETSAHADKAEIRLFKLVRDTINRESGQDDVLFDEIDKKAHKLLPAIFTSEDDSGKEIKIVDRHTGNARNVMEDSLILQGIIDKICICRLYTDKCNEDKVKAKVKELFGE